jgi:hypothetical protein
MKTLASEGMWCKPRTPLEKFDLGRHIVVLHEYLLIRTEASAWSRLGAGECSFPGGKSTPLGYSRVIGYTRGKVRDFHRS